MQKINVKENNLPSPIKLFFSQALGQIDWPLFFIVMALCITGVIFSYSSQILVFDKKVNLYDNYIRQTFYLVSGVGIMLFVSFINYRKLAQQSFLLYLVCVVVLLYTLFGGSVVNQSKRWIDFGFASLQPSEFVKVVTIIYAAYFLSRNKDHPNYLWRLSLLIFYLLIPVGLIVLQPDLGTAIIFVPVFFVMLVMSGIKPKYFFLLILCKILLVLGVFFLTYSEHYSSDSLVIKTISNKSFIFSMLGFFFSIALIFFVFNIKMKNIFLGNVSLFSFGIFLSLFSAGVLYHFLLKEYQKERLLVFFDPYKHKWDLGYNVIQSQTAIGAGGFWGRGLFDGLQGQLGFLPARTTDFIFSVVGEELGFIGTTAVVLLFFAFLLRLYQIAMKIKDDLGCLIIAGIFTMFSSQIAINLCMTVGMTPVTGVPLPFLSSGGSALWASLIAIGLVFSVNARRFVN